MLANIKLQLDSKQKKFLSFFQNTLFCYIHDSSDSSPIIHSEVLQLERQQQGYGIFFTVNGFTGGRRTNETLTNINGFFADIDYPDKVNKTDASVKQYKQELLMEMMEDELPIPTYVVETKNGFHVYWLLEKPVMLNELNPKQQEDLKLQYRQIEEAILERFDGDPGAKDAARVLRVPGTLHQKNPKEPFTVKIVHASPDECIYTFDEIREAFLKKTAPASWALVVSENAINDEVKASIEKEYPKLERDSYKKLFNKEPIPEGMRNKALLIAAYAAKEAGWGFEQTCSHFTDFHGLSLREVRKTVKSAYDHNYDFGYNNEVMQAVVTQDERVKLSEVTSKILSKATKEERAGTNNQQKEKYATYEYVLADRYPTLKYKDRGDFYEYREGVYRSLQAEEVRSMVFREMLKDGLTNYRTVSKANDKIATFKSIDGRTFKQEDENPNPNILNFKNGLLDIQNYQLLEHTPNYLSTSQIPVMYGQDAKCPRWMEFIREVTCDDPEQAKLLQQIAGYALTTDTNFAKAFIFYGAGANGKSMFTRILGKIVGRDNVSTLNLTTITRQFGVTGLVGKKVNFIDEISGNYFESNVIKGIISGERMSADVKYRPEPLEFVPTVKLIFSVNELPKINDTTPGLYRRFIIVPFDRSFEAKPDLQLEAKLTEELTGILNWAIEGLKSLRTEGRFNETERNYEVMRTFKSDNSPVVEFINLYYQPAPEGTEFRYSLAISELYTQYRGYCLDHGYKPKALANFSRELAHNRVDGFNVTVKSDGGKKILFGLRSTTVFGGAKPVYNDEPAANKDGF
jgi:P4 family phage/plasmid primase-like protien